MICHSFGSIYAPLTCSTAWLLLRAHDVMLGADELAGVAEALAAVCAVERRRVAAERKSFIIISFFPFSVCFSFSPETSTCRRLSLCYMASSLSPRGRCTAAWSPPCTRTAGSPPCCLGTAEGQSLKHVPICK
jgi:hypothetical protein